MPYTHYETPSFEMLPAENWNFRRRRKCFRKKIGTFDAVENASGEKLELSTPSKMLPEKNWDFRRRRKCFRKKIETFDAVENASGRKSGLSTPSKMLPEENRNFRRRRRKDISKKLLEKLPCFDRGAGEAAAETEGFIHTKRKPTPHPFGELPYQSRGAFQIVFIAPLFRSYFETFVAAGLASTCGSQFKGKSRALFPTCFSFCAEDCV